uniref:Uncharacterized protein n=1 Tax=Acrobeloides nanus TaxID=290746 RepID=A0A914E634_9BILA
MIFIIYWQSRGHIDYLFANITWPSDQDRTTLKSIKLTIMFMSFSLSLITVIFGLLAYFVATEQYEYLITNIEAMDAYRLKILRYLFILINYLGSVIWLIVLIFYVVFCIILHGKFIRFNQELEDSKILGIW